MNALAELKMPPHSTEAESALLAAMVESNRLINDLDFLQAEDFFRAEHQIVFSRLQALAFVGKPVDAVTLVNALDEADELDRAGGVEYLVDLLTQSRGPHNARSYADIVKAKAKARKMIQVGYRIAQMGYEDADVDASIDEAQGLTLGLGDQAPNDTRSVSEIMRLVVKDIDRRFHAKGEIIGLKTGFTQLDKMTAGLQDGQVVIVAGRPSMGKTTFAMNIAENAIAQDKFVLAFNLEMTGETLVMKTLSSLGKIPYAQLRAGRIEDHADKLSAAGAKINNRQLYIDDNASLTSQQILSRARKISQKVGKRIDLVIIDYLQLLNDRGDGHERITKISRALKIAAKELNCPVIVLSQLNRSLENRSDKRPIMSDLRESGAIEQDADIIIMLYRDEVYNEKSKEKGIAQAIVRKNREGEPGSIYLKSNLGICRFDNLDYIYEPPEETAKGGKDFAFLD